jgi:hypothetical protein
MSLALWRAGGFCELLRTCVQLATSVQAAAAYDTAARQIRGENAICNYPQTQQEQQNAEKYLVRIGNNSRKRRNDATTGVGAPASTQRRLTARQMARAASAPARALADEARLAFHPCMYQLPRHHKSR